MDGSAGERMLEDGEQGEIISWVGGWERGEEGAGVGAEFGGEGAGEVDFLQGGFGGREEFAEGEGVFLGLGGVDALKLGLGN